MNLTVSVYPTGDEALLKLGRTYYQNYSLDDPLRYSMYRKIYQNLIDNDVLLPFSREDEVYPVEAELDLGRGVLIVHTKGLGISILFKILHDLFRNLPYKFTKTTIFEIAKFFRNKEYGPKYLLEQYGYELKQHLVIDDCILGLMGDYTVEFMKELISERYRLYWDKGFRTHFCFEYTTTWKDSVGQVKDMLINVYGLETYRQLMEMNNLIVWQGEPFKNSFPDIAPRFNTYLKERSVK